MRYYEDKDGRVFESDVEQNNFTEITKAVYDETLNKKYYFTDGEGSYFVCGYKGKFERDQCWTTEITENEYIEARKSNQIENKGKQSIYIELSQIKKWFVETDYYINKIVTGEWTTDDSRWQNYLAERTIKRARQDELNALLLK